MRAVRSLLSAALALCARAAVVDLTDATFDAFVAQPPVGSGVMVEFFAPWCGACQAAEPEYAAAAAAGAAAARWARVDATAHRALAARFGVRGYPTFVHVDGAGAVRDALLAAHGARDFAAFARDGWRAARPRAPPGVLARARAAALRVGERALAVFEAAAEGAGAPPVAGQFVAALALLAAAAGSVGACGAWLGPRPVGRAALKEFE